MKRIRLDGRSLGLAAGLFIIECVIAMFFRDRWIRGFVGDVLVIGLLFYLLHGFLNFGTRELIGFVLLVAIAVEIGQAFGLVHRLGLGYHAWARVIFGTQFDGKDLLAYLLGAIGVYWAELRFGRSGPPRMPGST